jgi:hypothetical protein
MARSNNNNKLKAFVRFDGSGRIVPSSLIVQAFKPKVGNWKEIDAKECCNYTTTTTTTAVPTTTTSTTAAPTTTTTTTVAPTTTTTTTELLLQVRWQRADSGNACPSTNYIYLTGSPDFCSETDFYGDFSSIISSGTLPGAFVNIAGLSNGQYRTCQLVDSTHLTAFGTVACFNC